MTTDYQRNRKTRMIQSELSLLLFLFPKEGKISEEMHKHKHTQNTQHYLGNQWQKSHNNHNTISVLIQLHLSLAGDKPQAYKWPFHHYNPYPYNQELWKLVLDFLYSCDCNKWFRGDIIWGN